MYRLLDPARFLRIAIAFSVFLSVAVLLGIMPAASPAVQGASFQGPSSLASRPLNLTPADVRPATAAAVGPIELLRRHELRSPQTMKPLRSPSPGNALVRVGREGYEHFQIGPIELMPPLRPLSAGEPQTITLEIVPTTLIAHSGATAVVTATVVDLTGTPVSGVTLSGSITPTEHGTLSGLSATDQDGKSVGTWTATALSTAGVGTIEVFTNTITGSAPITLTADVPATVTLSAYPTILTVGETSTLTATVVDQYSSPVDDGTLVTFTSSLGGVASPISTSNGIATSTITSTQSGTAYITATSVGRSGFASVTFNPHTVFLPLVMQTDLKSIYSSWAVQFYDQLSTYDGFDQATAADIRWIRLRVSWFNIEPTNTTPDNYHWSLLDQSVAAARAAKVNLVVTLEGNPSWAASTPGGPVNNLNDFAQFTGALAARYPDIHYWEIYNEPDSTGNFGNRPAAYAAHLNTAYAAIKAANSNAKIVMGGVGMDWFTDQGGGFVRTFVNDMLTACIQPCFDVGNFHYYPVYRGKWEPYGRDIIGKANALRQMLAAKGYTRPVMSTETGWVYSTIPNTDWGGEAIQGRYVPKAFVRGIAAGLIVTNWYAMTDADPSQPGLLGGSYPSFQMRQAYTATLKFSQQLGAAKYIHALTQAETGSPNLEGYVFTNYKGAHGAERVDVIWYDCPSLIVDTPNLPVDCSNAASYTVPTAPIGVVNHLGGAMQILTDSSDGKVDGKVTLTISRNPVYIHYNP